MTLIGLLSSRVDLREELAGAAVAPVNELVALTPQSPPCRLGIPGVLFEAGRNHEARILRIALASLQLLALALWA